jgi:hypothetical protein
MKAVALSYFEDHPPPFELRLAQQVDRWGTLPDSGGLLDQEAKLLDRMAWASAVDRAVRGYTEAPNLANWIKHNGDAHDLYKYVIDLLGEDGD